MFLRKSSEQSKPCISAISPRSNLILEIHQPQVSWARLSKDTRYFEKFQGIPSFQKVVDFCRSADSLLKNNQQIGEAFKNSPLIVSVFGTESSNSEILLSANLSDPSWDGELSSILYSIFNKPGQIKEIQFQQELIYQLSPSLTSENHYCSASEGIFLLSTSQKSVEDALMQLNSNKSILDDASFAKAYKVAGKKTDANLFINYKSFGPWSGKVLESIGKESYLGIGNFASWSGIDINLKPESILISGFTWAQGTNLGISKFKQKPIEAQLCKYLPQSSSGFFFYGGSSLSDLGKEIYQSTHKSQSPDSITQHFLSWMGGELCLGILDNRDSSIQENAVLLITCNDSASASRNLAELANSGKGSGLRLLDEQFNGFSLKSLNNPGIFQSFFGSPIGTITNNYYTVIGPFVAFANNSTTLKNFITSYLSGRTLGNQDSYLKFNENLSKNSNIYLYSVPSSMGRKVRQFFSPTYLPNLGPYLDALNSFDAMAIQFANQGDGYYTSGYLSFGNSETSDSISGQEENVGWKAQLENPSSIEPLIIDNPLNEETEFIFLDDAHQLYCLSTLGRTKWKFDIKEKTKGPIYFLKNLDQEKPGLLVCTKNTIYGISLNGELLPNFPIKLDASCTSGISVFDYEKKGDYRFVFACSNEKAYNLDKTGKQVKGWTLSKVEEEIIEPFQYFQSNNKDILASFDLEGKLKLYERTGKKKTQVKEKFELSSSNGIFSHSGKNAKFPGLYFTTTDGTIIYVNGDGKIEKIKIKPVTQNHYFLAKDLDSDGTIEFIYVDLNEITIYSRQKKMIGNHKWEDVIGFPPQLISNGSKTNIGIVSGGNLFLLDSKAEAIEGFPMEGSTPFSVKFKDGKPKIVISTNGEKEVKIYSKE
ncbi:MAG: DUF3352 domain-containing protein [Bacteroidia bacterium]|nr:DUF3352 domain-containing protein [Bacteroidia bacterium]